MSFKLGEITLSMVNAEYTWDDGGAMFGVVPKAVWEKFMPPDDLNRIKFSDRCLIVDTLGRRVLLDTGSGDKMDEKKKARYGIEGAGVIKALAEAGAPPESVDLVVNTHLHFDHCGGNTTLDEKGEIVPVFPNARCLVQRSEWEAAMNPHEKQRAGYFAQELSVLEKAGLLELVEGETEVSPGVRVIPTPGHSEGHQSALIESGGEKALFLGDLCPTASHLPFLYVMAYDLRPAQNIEQKRRILTQAAEEGWLVIFGHDPLIEAAYIELDERGRPRATEEVTIGAPNL